MTRHASGAAGAAAVAAGTLLHDAGYPYSVAVVVASFGAGYLRSYLPGRGAFPAFGFSFFVRTNLGPGGARAALVDGAAVAAAAALAFTSRFGLPTSRVVARLGLASSRATPDAPKATPTTEAVRVMAARAAVAVMLAELITGFFHTSRP